MTRFLRNVVFNDQSRTTRRTGIPAVYLEIVCSQIVIVIQLESESELCGAIYIDKREGGDLQCNRVPTCCWDGSQYTNGIRARSSLEVCDHQICARPKAGIANIHDQIVVRLYRDKHAVTHKSLYSDLQFHLCNESFRWQTGGVERQEGSVLLILRAIADIQHGGSIVKLTVLTTCF